MFVFDKKKSGFSYFFCNTSLFFSNILLPCKLHWMQTETTWHKFLFLDQMGSLLRTFCLSNNTIELIIAWMTYNCSISIGLYSVCSQNDCILRKKPLWMPDSEMIPSIWYRLIHLCSWSCWHCTSQEHSLCTDLKTCIPTFQSLSSASSIVSKVLESYLQCICWCPSITNALECLQNQECWCQTPHTFAKHLVNHIHAPCWKASIASKAIFFEKQHVLKYSSISCLFHSIFWKWYWAYFRAWLRNLKIILQGLNKSSSLMDLSSGALGLLMFPSFPFLISFSSKFDCWVIFVFWKPTVLFDNLVHQSPLTLHTPLQITEFLKCGITLLSLFFRQCLHDGFF